MDNPITYNAFISYLAYLSSISYRIPSNISNSLKSIHRADSNSGPLTVNVCYLTGLTCHSPTFLLSEEVLL